MIHLESSFRIFCIHFSPETATINHVSPTSFFPTYLVLHEKKKKEIMCNTRKTVLSATHTTAPRCVLMRDERRGRQRRRRRGEGGREPTIGRGGERDIKCTSAIWRVLNVSAAF